MAIQTGALRDAMAATYADLAVEAALYTTVPGATAGTEVTGGSYARKTLSWSDSGDGVQTATVTFDVPASTTVKGAGVHDESGTYLDGGAVTEQAFASDGTYTLTLTYTQS